MTTVPSTKRTVFYAWQSDTDPDVNHHFIGKALQRAIARLNVELELHEAENELSFDRDTYGEPGMPPVADTVLRKIDKAAIFVADLTFVTILEAKQKGLPNANVGIELGWAARAIGFERIVCVFNDHYGSPDRLPFDLAHRRFPIRYRLAPNASTEDRTTQATALADALTNELRAIVAILGSVPPPQEEELPMHAVRPVRDSAFVGAGQIARTRSKDAEGRDNEYVFWHQSPCVWLRLIPAMAKDLGRSQLSRLVRQSPIMLRPFGEAPRSQLESNEFGMVAIGHYDDTVPTIAMEITQVFQSGEMWGVNRMLIDSNPKEPGRTLQIPWPMTGQVFSQALAHYRTFSRDVLQLPLPITIVAGLAAINGVPLIREKSKWFANAPRPAPLLESLVIRRTIMNRWDVEQTPLLEPFFERIFDACAESYTDWRSRDVEQG